MSLPFNLSEILLRQLSDPNYSTKNSELTWIELDTNIKLLADAIASLSIADAPGVVTYSTSEEYSEGDVVSYDGNIWLFVNPVPQTGITPGTDELTWELSSTGIFAHVQNTDQYLDFGGPNEVSAEDLKNAVNAIDGIPSLLDEKISLDGSSPETTGLIKLGENQGFAQIDSGTSQSVISTATSGIVNAAVSDSENSVGTVQYINKDGSYSLEMVNGTDSSKIEANEDEVKLSVKEDSGATTVSEVAVTRDGVEITSGGFTNTMPGSSGQLVNDTDFANQTIGDITATNSAILDNDTINTFANKTQGQINNKLGGATIYPYAYLDNKLVIVAFTDSNDDVFYAKFVDGTEYGTTALEVEGARGYSASLSERMNLATNPEGSISQVYWGLGRAKVWNNFLEDIDIPYNLVLIGDSFTDGFYSSYFLDELLNLSSGINSAYGGPGWCGFGYFTSGGLPYPKNSIRPSELSITIAAADWSTGTNSYGPDSAQVTATGASKSIVITPTVNLDSITILYERHSGSPGFQYRVNVNGAGGAYTNVTTSNATQDLQMLVIDVSAQVPGTTPYTIDILSLGAGVILHGALAKRTGNVLTVHKCGHSGGVASNFGANSLWSTGMSLLNPSGVVIMFGTNEQVAFVEPETFRTNLQNIITIMKAINPILDIWIMAPSPTKYGNTETTVYSLDQYCGILFQVAQANNGVFINHNEAVGPYSSQLVTDGFIQSDEVHPGIPRGCKLMARNTVKAFKL